MTHVSYKNEKKRLRGESSDKKKKLHDTKDKQDRKPAGLVEKGETKGPKKQQEKKGKRTGASHEEKEEKAKTSPEKKAKETGAMHEKSRKSHSKNRKVETGTSNAKEDLEKENQPLHKTKEEKTQRLHKRERKETRELCNEEQVLYLHNIRLITDYFLLLSLPLRSSMRQYRSLQ